jgi:DNA-binding response OmpR family regulator
LEGYPVPLSRHKLVVIVEDDYDIADVMQQALHDQLGLPAIVAHDGEGALELLDTVRADLVVLDSMLPQMSGLEVYDTLRQTPATSNLPVIFCTATSDLSGFRARKIPVEDIILKPFELDDLLRRVTEVCGIEGAMVTPA